MHTGRSKIGSHKHATSGTAPPSPGTKLARAREANALAESERARRPTIPVYASVANALKAQRKTK